jgi:DNA-binding transcriptional LysR family regulator
VPRQGLAIVPQAFADIHIPNIVYRDIASDTPLLSSITFIYRRDEASPAARAFAKFVRGQRGADQ